MLTTCLSLFFVVMNFLSKHEMEELPCALAARRTPKLFTSSLAFPPTKVTCTNFSSPTNSSRMSPSSQVKL